MVANSNLHFIDSFKSPIKAAFTLRTGGVSSNCYASFNLGLHVGDDPALVNQNRAVLKKSFAENIVWMNQTHSCDVVVVDKPTDIAIDADGIVTANDNLALAVMTADCLPLLLCADDGSSIAAVHCGWRGIFGGIIKNAVDAMQNIHKCSIKAYMGPCIGPKSFEVGAELFDKFKEVMPNCDSAFVKSVNDKYLCNLYMLCRMHLQECDISEVFCENFDTYADKESFFSYRRDHDTGRMASLIVKK